MRKGELGGPGAEDEDAAAFLGLRKNQSFRLDFSRHSFDGMDSDTSFMRAPIAVKLTGTMAEPGRNGRQGIFSSKEGRRFLPIALLRGLNQVDELIAHRTVSVAGRPLGRITSDGQEMFYIAPDAIFIFADDRRALLSEMSVERFRFGIFVPLFQVVR